MTSWLGRGTRHGGLVVIIALAAFALVASAPLTDHTPHIGLNHRLPALAKGFVSNTGLLDRRVSYWSRNAFGDTYVLGDGRLLHALPAGTVKEGGVTKRRVWAVVERASSVDKTPVGMRKYDATTFFIPRGHQTATPLQSYENLEIPQAWPGVDLELRHTREGIERVFTVAPGARTDQIRVSLDGANGARLTADGDLNLTTGVGTIRYKRPAAYQLGSAGEHVSVPISYKVLPGETSFGFTVGGFDESKALIIDPLLQGTYLGEGNNEAIFAMAVDPGSGEVLVAGTWNLTVPPEVAGGFQTTIQTGEVFVAKTDANLEQVIVSTVLGGVSNEDAYALAVDPRNGEVVVGGDTESLDFPGGGGSDEPVHPDSLGSAFVSRLSSDLHRLEQTTFFSATLGSTKVRDIAINATSGDVYVVGSDLNGAVVTRYNDQLTHILGRYVIQGNVEDQAKGVAINQVSGDVYVAGTTSSWIFPKLAGGAFSSTAHPIPTDFSRAFVARFDAALSTHVQSTFLWNGVVDEFTAYRIPVIVDPSSGDVLVAAAAEGDLGPIPGGAQPAYAGGQTDGLIVRFSGDLTTMRSATYFGGTGDEGISGLGISADGRSIFVGGLTSSATLPGSSGTAGIVGNAMLARLSADLSVVHSSIIYGAPASLVYGYALQIHPQTGEPYLAGVAQWGLSGTRGGLQPQFIQSGQLVPIESFIARFDPLVSTSDSVTPAAFSFPTQTGVAPGSVVTTPAARIYGYTAPVAIQVSNGSYSLDGGTFTTAGGTLQPGQRVQVQLTAPLAAGVDTQAVLTIGGVSGTFDAITQSGTTVTPSAFNFIANNSAVPSLWITSNPVVVQGTDAPAPISVLGGQYSIDGGAFTSAAGAVNSGQSVVVGQTTASAPGTQTDTVLTIGGQSSTFSTVTEPLNTVPHAFAFLSFVPPAYTMVANTDTASYPAMITGINGPAPISVVGGQYSINAPAAWTSTPGVVNNLDVIIAQVHTGAAGSSTTVTVTVGGVSGSFTVGVPGPIPATQVPKSFSFQPVNGVEPTQWIQLAPVALEGFTESAVVSFGPGPGGLGQANAEWYDPTLREFVSTPGWLAPGQPLTVRILAIGYDTTDAVMVSVGGTSALASTTSIAQGGSTTPTPFQFQAHSGVTPGSVITSETIQLKGLGAPSSVSVSGGQVSITGGPFGSGGTVLNGDTLTLQITAPGPGQSANYTVSVGSYSDVVQISSSGQASSSSSSGGGGGGAQDVWSLLVFGLLAVRRFASTRVAARAKH